jgi:hypothetical protein
MLSSKYQTVDFICHNSTIQRNLVVVHHVETSIPILIILFALILSYICICIHHQYYELRCWLVPVTRIKAIKSTLNDVFTAFYMVNNSTNIIWSNETELGSTGNS